jgi:fucose 4-O-acetylase-like acetyltransferase
MSSKTADLERIAWVDYAKAIGIFLIIFAHNKQLNNFYGLNIVNVFYSFHIQLFFLLAGFLQKERPFVKNLSHSFFTLIIPYILWYIITCGMFFGATAIFEKGRVWDIKDIAIGGLLGNPSAIGKHEMVNPQLWFLIALFWIKLLHNFYEKYLFKKSKIFYCIASIIPIIAVFILKKHNIVLWFCINQTLLCMPFFCAGYLLKKQNILRKENIEKLTTKSTATAAVLFLLFFYILYANVINNGVDSSIIIWGKYLPLYYINAFAGIAFVLLISMCMPCKPQLFEMPQQRAPLIIRAISSNTLIIFALSEPVRKIPEAYIPNFNQSWHYLITVPLSVAQLFICLGFAVLLNRFLPILGGKQSGFKTLRSN